jgi:hypothetical protein
MQYTTLGKTDLKVSKICLGTMTYGEQNTEAEGHAQFDFALDHGVNFIDTAELYAIPRNPDTQGSTERIIGTWLKKSGKRDQVVVASKIAGPSQNLEHIRTDLGFGPKQLNEALHLSLDRYKQIISTCTSCTGRNATQMSSESVDTCMIRTMNGRITFWKCWRPCKGTSRKAKSATLGSPTKRPGA